MPGTCLTDACLLVWSRGDSDEDISDEDDEIDEDELAGLQADAGTSLHHPGDNVGAN